MYRRETAALIEVHIILPKRNHLDRSQRKLENYARMFEANIYYPIARGGNKNYQRRGYPNAQIQIYPRQTKLKTANESAMNDVKANDLVTKPKSEPKAAPRPST